MEKLFCNGTVAELFITFCQPGLLFRGEPVWGVAVEEGFGLCIELGIVDVGGIVYRLFDLYTDKAAVTGDIGQQFFVVTGGYKRGVPFACDKSGFVSGPGGDFCFGQDMFQESLVAGTDLVETVEGEFCLFFTAEIDPVCIEVAEFRG